MGTERFIAWVATGNGMNTFRLSMAMLGAFIMVVWESLRLWPDKWRQVGRLAFLWLGGGSYVVLLAVALYSLVRAFAGYR